MTFDLGHMSKFTRHRMKNVPIVQLYARYEVTVFVCRVLCGKVVGATSSEGILLCVLCFTTRCICKACA